MKRQTFTEQWSTYKQGTTGSYQTSVEVELQMFLANVVAEFQKDTNLNITSIEVDPNSGAVAVSTERRD